MIVGAAVVELHVHDSQSLKAKRGVVRSLVGRVRSRFNVSISEVGGQDTWQRAVLGLSMTGGEEVPVRRALAQALTFIEDQHLAQVLAQQVEILRLPLVDASDPPGPGAEDESWPPSGVERLPREPQEGE